MYSFNEHDFPFWDGYRESFKVKDFILPHVWIEENFRLSTAYATEGAIKLFLWQYDPVDAIVYFDTVIYIGPVQTGKSMLAEAVAAYKIDTDNINMMFIYAKKDTVMDVFDERLKPLVREVPAIKKYWSGLDDDLTKRKIKLRHLIIRIASAGIKTDIATHNAGFIYGSEVAKWAVKDFSVTKAIEGRKQASRMMGKQTKTLYETSPDNDRDPSYIESHKPGTVVFKPYYPCPFCGEYQLINDRGIKEIPNSDGEKDHSPERIRLTGAAYFECCKCSKKILDEHRLDMSRQVVYKTKTGKTFQQIIKDPNRSRRAVFNWNRLVDDTWTFAECLATFFESLQSPDANALKTYRNEDMAEWVNLVAKRHTDDFIPSKILKYHQYGSDAYIPDGVSVLLIGVDTQDNGFYFVVRGFGQRLESWLIRHDFIFCDMKDDDYNNNPANVFEQFTKEVYRYPYQKRDGTTIPILWGFIDRGGHRSKDVDFISDHSSNLGVYIGSTYRNAPLIEQKKSGFYHGHTENLSRNFLKHLESNLCHFPEDVGKAYCEQVINQYDEKVKDGHGIEKKRWEQKDPDHYRDCENYIWAGIHHLDLFSQLYDEDTIAEIVKATHEKQEETPDKQKQKEGRKKKEKKENILSDYEDEMALHGW